MPDQVFLPVTWLVLGILVPEARSAGKPDQDQIVPSVAVHVVAKVAKAVAVAFRAVVFAGCANLVHLPIGGLVPDISGHNVNLAVVIDVERGHAFGAEGFIEIDPLPMNVVGQKRESPQHEDAGPTQGLPSQHDLSPGYLKATGRVAAGRHPSNRIRRSTRSRSPLFSA